MMEDGQILITPTFAGARDLVQAGADMIALDCTIRGQRYGALERIQQIKADLGVPVLADIATADEAVAAANAGADFVLSTMRGYTERTQAITSSSLSSLRSSSIQFLFLSSPREESARTKRRAPLSAPGPSPSLSAARLRVRMRSPAALFPRSKTNSTGVKQRGIFWASTLAARTQSRAWFPAAASWSSRTRRLLRHAKARQRCWLI